MVRTNLSNHYRAHISTLRRCQLLALVLASSLLGASASAAEGGVTLGWDPNPEPSVVGYRIHYGENSGDYDHVVDVGNRVLFEISDLQAGQTYYASLQAYDSEGVMSPFSEELSFLAVPIQTVAPPFEITEISVSNSGGTGQLEITMNGESGVAGTLMSSENLTDWERVQDVTLDGGPQTLVLSDIGVHHSRFYRVIFSP